MHDAQCTMHNADTRLHHRMIHNAEPHNTPCAIHAIQRHTLNARDQPARIAATSSSAMLPPLRIATTGPAASTATP
jgi:hypothetical protein